MKKFFKKLLQILLICIGGFFIFIGILWLMSPDVSYLKAQHPKTTQLMTIRAAAAKERGNASRKYYYWVSLDEISAVLINSIVIVEDDKFYQHSGFDWQMMKSAVKENVEKREFHCGASTITQQLAKNLYLSPDKNIIRKIKEAIIAYKLETALSKSRILELYLNVIEFGDHIYGVEAASLIYFQKSANALSPSEAIRLASILPNPRKYSPYDTPIKWLNDKRAYTARRLYEREVITHNKYEELMAEFNNSRVLEF
jgi:monofunctional biosynthetic peptidoglycan transglycosylase